ncbi:MAG: glycogen debranching protein, partial [Thermoanaerobaculia bacterium]
PESGEAILYHSDAFTVTSAGVRQGPFVATALSRDRIVTNYPRAAAEAIFKFSINSLESEFPPGTDHMIVLRPEDGRIVTLVYHFGVPDPVSMPVPTLETSSEEGPVEVTFRVDMTEMLDDFRTKGEYDPPNAPPVKAEEFEAVYVIGNTPPLTWDFASLRPGSPLQLHDPDGDGIYAVTLPFEATYTRPLDDEGRAVWSRSRDLSRFPRHSSDQILVDALHRLSLEEVLELKTEEGTVVAGARWPNVWTRDTAWGVILALAAVAPEESKASLLSRIDEHGRIIQDTGTGGSWPVSTDRVSWAVAAWELYVTTGSHDWLRTAYGAIRRSVEADLAVAVDPVTGLFRGESSFLDWREQSYPRWMDPKDIYLSQALGTNALHYETYRILGRMARELGEPAERWDAIAEDLRDAMNASLWQADRGWYGQFLYGRNFASLSPRAEGMGEAFAILFDVATEMQEETLARRMPVVAFGVPSFWPYIPGVPPYHNAGIWPQVVGFWAWAAAEAGNAAGVEHALGSIYRASALFLTNKENMVAPTGHFEGTELNSDRLIGSVAANLATVYRVLFGMRFHPDRLAFEPFVPEGYAGERRLEGFRWREATLDVVVRGFGDRVSEARLDGQPLPRAEVPATLNGRHEIEIVLDGSLEPSAIHLVDDLWSPPTPATNLDGAALSWEPVEKAVSYEVHRNGGIERATTGTSVAVTAGAELAEYQVLAIGERGLASFLSEPVRAGPERIVEFQDGPVRVTPSENTLVHVPIEVDRAGVWSIDVLYANGSGPVNSNDRAAVRSLLVDGERAGALVMPQRGMGAWDEFGYSSPVHVRLDAGAHRLTIAYREIEANMDVEVNDAVIRAVRMVLVEKAQ